MRSAGRRASAVGERRVSSSEGLGAGGLPLCKAAADPMASASSGWQNKTWMASHSPRNKVTASMRVLGVGQFEG